MSVDFRFARPEDYAGIRELIRDGFPEEAARKPRALEELAQESWYDSSHLIVGEVSPRGASTRGEGGRLVSMTGLRTGELYCGGTSFNAVLVGTVCTRSELRGKGIGSRMLAHAAGVMDEWGVEVSYLHTGPERWAFYGRNGYKKAILKNARLDVERLAPSAGGVEIREANASDARALDRIHREHFSPLHGAWSRDINFWERRVARKEKLWLPEPPRLLVAEGEKAVAYLALAEGEVQELACVRGGEDAALALAERAFEEAARERLTFRLPERDPLWGRLVARGARKAAEERVVFIRAHDGNAVRAKVGEERASSGLDASDLAALFLNGRRLDGLVEEGAVKPEQSMRLRELFPETAAMRPVMDGY